MNPREAEAYLTSRVEDAGFVVLDRDYPSNLDALVLMVGSKDDNRCCALSVGMLEMLDHPDLLNCRAEQAISLMRELSS